MNYAQYYGGQPTYNSAPPAFTAMDARRLSPGLQQMYQGILNNNGGPGMDAQHFAQVFGRGRHMLGGGQGSMGQPAYSGQYGGHGEPLAPIGYAGTRWPSYRQQMPLATQIGMQSPEYNPQQPGGPYMNLRLPQQNQYPQYALF